MVIHQVYVYKDGDDTKHLKLINFESVVMLDLNYGETKNLDGSTFISCKVISYKSYSKEGKVSEWIIQNCWVNFG